MISKSTKREEGTFTWLSNRSWILKGLVRSLVSFFDGFNYRKDVLDLAKPLIFWMRPSIYFFPVGILSVNSLDCSFKNMDKALQTFSFDVAHAEGWNLHHADHSRARNYKHKAFNCNSKKDFQTAVGMGGTLLLPYRVSVRSSSVDSCFTF